MATELEDDLPTKQREQRQAAEDRQAATYNDMVADRNRADRFILDWQSDHENGERNKRHLQEAQWRREAESDITDVNARALLAAGESRDFVQAVRREGAMITEEHSGLQRKIALEDDPDKKHLLELKRDIQHADYMALSNERIAAMSNLNGEQYKEAMQQQEAWSNIGTDLRKERIELQERMADQQMQSINDSIERLNAERINAADQQRAEFRADIRGFDPTAHPDEPAMRAVARMYEAAKGRVDDIRPDAPETPREAAQVHEASAASSMPGQPATRTTEPERPAEVILSGPTVPEREPATVREIIAASQIESSTAEPEITDAKAAKLAALAQNRAETEQGIAAAHERGFENSR
jgi:hypothetical protein